MDILDLRLSVEEVALGISTLGYPDLAHNLMIAQLGSMTKEEMRSRLLSAVHALLARGLVTLSRPDTIHLENGLKKVAEILTQADYSIRYQRSYQNAQFLISFHLFEGQVFKHEVEYGVVHHIRQEQGVDSVIQEGITFFEPASVPFITSRTDIPIPQEVLEDLKDKDDVDIVYQQLKQIMVNDEVAELLSVDLVRFKYRGSVLRVEYDEHKKPRSESGLLILGGEDRIWLIRPPDQTSKDYAHLLPGTRNSLSSEVASLISS